MTTYYESDAAIARLSRDFLGCTLPKAEWTHAAHFATTLWLMRNAPGRDLPHAMPGLIRAYNESVGGVNSDTAGYHETITQASLRAARAFMATRPADEPLHEAVDALMKSMLGASDWPLAYWSRGRLFAVDARRAWVEPDLQPLPF
ncbi:hypothetical protein [Sphingomonas sp. MMS24-J13]|uniref:hypothetical protein n=1 Tax=Sphingomonas sp. MMS24-J13 TaxID=3238686 RepID=UPI00384BD7D6